MLDDWPTLLVEVHIDCFLKRLGQEQHSAALPDVRF